MTPARFRWGMTLILAGALALLRNLGYLSGDDLVALLMYFPFLLIALGIEKIFTGSRLEFISYLSTIALVGGVFYLGFMSSRSERGGDYFSELEITKELNPSVQRILAVLDIDDGELTIRDATEDIVYARFREWSGKPDFDYSISDREAKVRIKRSDSSPFGYLVRVESDASDDWRVSFSKEIPLYLTCVGNEGSMHLNLSTTPLRKLFLEADETEVYLKLGRLLPVVDVQLAGKESMFRIRIPNDVGLQMSGEDLDRLFKRVGLVKQGSFYKNSGYDTLLNKITIEFDDQPQEVSIDYY